MCQTLRRDNAPVFNSKVGLLTRYLRVVLEPLLYPFFGVIGVFGRHRLIFNPRWHPLGQYKLYKSLQGAVLCSLCLLHCTLNWGVDCVLAYNSVLLCHFICCNIFYRAFDIVLLNYSCVLLNLIYELLDCTQPYL